MHLDAAVRLELDIELDDEALAAKIGHDWKNREEYDADDGSVVHW